MNRRDSLKTLAGLAVGAVALPAIAEAARAQLRAEDAEITDARRAVWEAQRTMFINPTHVLVGGPFDGGHTVDPTIRNGCNYWPVIEDGLPQGTYRWAVYRVPPIGPPHPLNTMGLPELHYDAGASTRVAPITRRG